MLFTNEKFLLTLNAKKQIVSVVMHINGHDKLVENLAYTFSTTLYQRSVQYF